MIDNIEIEIKAGSGGNGSTHFHREKFVPRGGPDGGDGGNGGNLVLEAAAGLTTLSHFRNGQRFTAENGGPGLGKKKRGKDGTDLVIQVPVGTTVYRVNQGFRDKRITDIVSPEVSVLLCAGGDGGRGNIHFATSINQTPLIAEGGEKGEGARIRLELKLLADVGVIGAPNAGKSSFMSFVSRARPRIAPYPFTTTEPVLGVVDFGGRSVVMAEIPGLIEGAHLGIGLGDKFLRHAERTKVLLHLIDGSADNPIENYLGVNRELLAYDRELAVRPQIIAINKVDLPEVRNRISEIQNLFTGTPSPTLFISAVTGEGLDSILQSIMKALPVSPVLFPKRQPLKKLNVTKFNVLQKNQVVQKDSNHFLVSWPKAERLVRGTNLSDWRAVAQLRGEFKNLGLLEALNQSGVQLGDTIMIGDTELEWS
jgi:GTP-binding protein